MAVKRFVVEEERSSNELIWFNEYLENLISFPFDEVFVIESVYFGKKGAILETNCFKCFLWKSGRMHNFLREALEYYAKQNSESDAILLIPDETLKDKFTLGTDDEISAFWVKKTENLFKNTISQEESKPVVSESLVSNPLISVSPKPERLTQTRGRKKKSTEDGGETTSPF